MFEAYRCDTDFSRFISFDAEHATAHTAHATTAHTTHAAAALSAHSHAAHATTHSLTPPIPPIPMPPIPRRPFHPFPYRPCHPYPFGARTGTAPKVSGSLILRGLSVRFSENQVCLRCIFRDEIHGQLFVVHRFEKFDFDSFFFDCFCCFFSKVCFFLDSAYRAGFFYFPSIVGLSRSRNTNSCCDSECIGESDVKKRLVIFSLEKTKSK